MSGTRILRDAAVNSYASGVTIKEIDEGYNGTSGLLWRSNCYGRESGNLRRGQVVACYFFVGAGSGPYCYGVK